MRGEGLRTPGGEEEGWDLAGEDLRGDWLSALRGVVHRGEDGVGSFRSWLGDFFVSSLEDCGNMENAVLERM